MDSIGDVLNRKASDLNIDEKRDEISLLQHVLERYFRSGVKATQITNRRSAIVKVRNSSLASEVRMQQITIMEEANRLLKSKLERLVIRQ